MPTTPPPITITRTRRRTDPLPTDGSGCIQCGKDRKPERSRAYGGLNAEVDPFCSRACCENYHGIEDASKRLGRPTSTS